MLPDISILCQIGTSNQPSRQVMEPNKLLINKIQNQVNSVHYRAKYSLLNNFDLEGSRTHFPTTTSFEISAEKIHLYDNESWFKPETLINLNQIVDRITSITGKKVMENIDFVAGFRGEIDFELSYQNHSLLFVVFPNELRVVKLGAAKAKQYNFIIPGQLDLMPLFENGN